MRASVLLLLLGCALIACSGEATTLAAAGVPGAGDGGAGGDLTDAGHGDAGHGDSTDAGSGGGADAGPPTDAGTIFALTPEVRFVARDVTVRVDATTLAYANVLEASYSPDLTRVTVETPWDLHDPITGRYIAQYDDGQKKYLWSVGKSDPQLVEFRNLASGPFDDGFSFGVMSVDGQRVYLSSSSGAWVATRTGRGLTFSALVPLGNNVQIVHDVSRDGTRAVVSGNRSIKWDADNVVGPRQVSVFSLRDDGSLDQDETKLYPPLANDYVQAPHFLADSRSLVFEGDDDLDTGDHLFVYTFGDSASHELHPQPLVAMDFDTPCALPDDRIVFWESDDERYIVRVFDSKANRTSTVRNEWYPFSGYVRCR